MVDLVAALRPDAPLVHPDWASYVPTSGTDYPRGGNLAAESVADPPGVDEAFARAHRVVDDEFVVQRQYQAYLEPKSAVGIYRDGRYTVHTAHQFPYNVRDRVAQFLTSGRRRCGSSGTPSAVGSARSSTLGLEPYARPVAGGARPAGQAPSTPAPRTC